LATFHTRAFRVNRLKTAVVAVGGEESVCRDVCVCVCLCVCVCVCARRCVNSKDSKANGQRREGAGDGEDQVRMTVRVLNINPFFGVGFKKRV
jgi:hypothetical protein